MKYILILIGITVIFSLAFFGGCDDNPTESNDNIDTLYVYDTLFVYDTVATIDTVIQTLIDTFYTIDTLRFFDTVYVEDSIFISSQSIFHIPPSGILAPALSGNPCSRHIIFTDFHSDSIRVSANLDGEALPVLFRGGGVYQIDFYGTDIDDSPLPIGYYTIEISITAYDYTELASFSDTIEIISCGIGSITFTGDQEYLYHKVTPAVNEYIKIADTCRHYVLGDGVNIFDDTGEFITSPEPWWQSHYPPFEYTGDQNYNIPAVYLLDDIPSIEADVVCEYPIRVYSANDSILAMGDELSLDEIDLSTCGRKFANIDFRFSVQIDDEWYRLPGYQRTEHILYAVLDTPLIRNSESYAGSPALGWMAGIALASEWCDGENTIEGATAKIRNGIFYDMGFNYSGRNYTSYDGSYYEWDRIHFYFADFLDMADGPNLYCHDVACGFTTMAGCMGINLPYVYLGWGFSTNRLRGIGHSSFSTHSWTAHSVNSLDGAETVYDACLNLDGDDNPGSTPCEDMEVIAMPIDDYIGRLTASSEPPEVRHSGYPYVY
ncbi:MAG: hypothetical protein ACLFSQ_11975 [Candidatus Zixiibacteriota bacterium]